MHDLHEEVQTFIMFYGQRFVSKTRVTIAEDPIERIGINSRDQIFAPAKTEGTPILGSTEIKVPSLAPNYRQLSHRFVI